MRQVKVLSIILVLIAMASAVFAEPPASSGIVTRGSYDVAWADVDIDSGLLSIVGVDIVLWCTDGAPFDTVFYQDKDLQNGFP